MDVVSKVKQVTAWRHIMAQTLNWHKMEVKILNKNCALSPTLAHFCLTNNYY